MTKDDVVKHFGSRKKVCEALGIGKAAISHWVTVPKLRQLEIEKITNGKLKASYSVNFNGEDNDFREQNARS